jgi:hypothetical protein
MNNNDYTKFKHIEIETFENKDFHQNSIYHHDKHQIQPVPNNKFDAGKAYFPYNTSPTKSELKESIRIIPVDKGISNLVYQIIQTQDVFQISFWYFSENDINVYEFRNFDDIYEEIKKELDKLTLLSQTMREKILNSISHYSKEINTNIQHLGAAQILD